jgi:GINS complex subunit 3
LSVEEERVPCQTNIDFAGLGHLDSTSTHEDLAKWSKIEVPLWLAELLAKKGHASVDMPKHYSERFRAHLQAGPVATNLREHSPNFFAVGESLARIMADNDLQEALKFAYTGERFNRIMDLAFNSQHEDVTEERRSFTEAELDLFTAGARATKGFSQWKRRSGSTLSTTPVFPTATAGVQVKRQKR